MEKKKMTMFAVLIAVLIVGAMLFSFGLTRLSGGTPAVRLPQITEGDTPGQNSASPGGATAGGNYLRVEVTPETVQGVIATLTRSESYSRVVNVETLLEGSKIGETSVSCWVTRGYTAARMRVGGKVRHSITGNGKLYVWYEGDGTWYEGALGGLSPDILQRIPTYEDVLKVDKGDIEGAGYQMLEGVPCIYVEVAEDELGYTEAYWISVESGLLVCSETRKGGKVVWRMSSFGVEIPMPSNAPFVLPDGTDVRASATASP